MKTKRILCLILTLVFIFCLCSCREVDNGSGSSIVESKAPVTESVIDNTVADDTVSVELSETEDTVTSVVEQTVNNDETDNGANESAESKVENTVLEQAASSQPLQEQEVSFTATADCHGFPPYIPSTYFYDTESYITWLKDKNKTVLQGDELFLKATRALKKAVAVTISEDVEDRFYIKAIFSYSSSPMMTYGIGDNVEGNHYIIDVLPNISEYKDMSLTEYKNAVNAEKNEYTLQSATRNGVDYVYSDYVKENSEGRFVYSQARFVLDDFIICIYDNTDSREKPFNPECLDWFEFEVVDIDI